MLRPVKILLPWFEPQEAVAALLGFRMPNVGDDVTEQRARYEAQRATVMSRTPLHSQTSAIDPLPDVIAHRGEALLRSLGNDAPPGAQVGVIDLGRTISIQKSVSLDHALERTATTPDDWEALADICLAPPGADPADIQGNLDQDGKGITISSPNPNLRVSNIQTLEGLAGSGTRFTGFAVSLGTRHLWAMEHHGRMFLKDGYHRAYGLLSRGISRVPCLYARAESLQSIHQGNPTYIHPDHLLGEHPPLVADFLDPEVSVATTQQSFRRAIRVRAEEFAVFV